jgi:PKD repeat protein
MKKIVYAFPLCFLLLASCSKKDTICEAQSTAPETLSAKFNFTVSDPNNIYENQVIKLENLSTKVDHCVWEFGNATKSQALNPELSYPYHGFYTVKLTVFDKDGNRATATQDFSILCNFAGGNHSGTGSTH